MYVCSSFQCFLTDEEIFANTANPSVRPCAKILSRKFSPFPGEVLQCGTGGGTLELRRLHRESLSRRVCVWHRCVARPTSIIRLRPSYTHFLHRIMYLYFVVQQALDFSHQGILTIVTILFLKLKRQYHKTSMLRSQRIIVYAVSAVEPILCVRTGSNLGAVAICTRPFC